MGAEMAAAAGAYDDVWLVGAVLLTIAWCAVAARIIRNEEADDGD